MQRLGRLAEVFADFSLSCRSEKFGIPLAVKEQWKQKREGGATTSDVGSDKGPEPGDVAQSRGIWTEALMDCIQIDVMIQIP